jgi:hypothetical protein
MVSVHDFNSAIAIAGMALLPQHEIIQERGPCLRGKKKRVNTMHVTRYSQKSGKTDPISFVIFESRLDILAELQHLREGK